jgi:hypothetical protein
MTRYLIVTLIIAQPLLPLTAESRELHGAASTDWNMCAWSAQNAVARRHGLTDRADGAVGSQIYKDPRMSQEADEAFDACVKRQSGGRRSGV